MTPPKPRLLLTLFIGPKDDNSGTQWVAMGGPIEAPGVRTVTTSTLVGSGGTSHFLVRKPGRDTLTSADWINWLNQLRSRDGVLVGRLCWSSAVISPADSGTSAPNGITVTVEFIPLRTA